MTIQETPIDAERFPEDWFYWKDLFDLIKSPLETGIATVPGTAGTSLR
jgi:hypothetical protein